MNDCAHEKQIPRLFTKSNGATAVKMQCEACGVGLQEKPKAQFEMSMLKPFDFEFRKTMQDLEHRQYQSQIQETRQKQRDDWFAGYSQYLVTEHWARIRAAVMQRDVWCQVCFRVQSEQAHHISYESFRKWGVSFAVECVGVCASCHDKLHPKDAI